MQPIVFRMRMRELRELVTSSASGERLIKITEELGESMGSHEERLKELVNQVYSEEYLLFHDERKSAAYFDLCKKYICR